MGSGDIRGCDPEQQAREKLRGVLQQVPLKEGQRITTGTNLARVGDRSVTPPC